jgi:hypothetical protein
MPRPERAHKRHRTGTRARSRLHMTGSATDRAKSLFGPPEKLVPSHRRPWVASPRRRPVSSSAVETRALTVEQIRPAQPPRNFVDGTAFHSIVITKLSLAERRPTDFLGPRSRSRCSRYGHALERTGRRPQSEGIPPAGHADRTPTAPRPRWTKVKPGTGVEKGECCPAGGRGFESRRSRLSKWLQMDELRCLLRHDSSTSWPIRGPVLVNGNACKYAIFVHNIVSGRTK